MPKLICKYFCCVLAVFLLLLGGKTVAEQGFVTVSSTVTKEVEPNQAEITFSIETNDKTAQESSNKNKLIAQKVISAIKTNCKDTDIISLKTMSFSVYPEYSWTKDNKKHLNGYSAKNSVVLVSKNIKDLGKVIDAALNAGASKVSNLNMSLDSADKICTTAIQEAARNTKINADAVAKVLGSSVTGIKSINTHCNKQRNTTSYRMMSMADNDAVSPAQSEPTPIEAGKIKVVASVDAGYYLK